MADKLKDIPNAYTQNYTIMQLVVETFEQHNEPTNQDSLKFPRLLSQRIRKRYCKTLRTSVINSPMIPPSLHLQNINPSPHPVYILFHLLSF